MNTYKRLYLASASLLAIGLGAAAPAQAFDNVDWSWTKDISVVENVDITVNDTFDLSGLAEVEKIQVNLGNISATSTVTDITNNPPGDFQDPGSILIDETFVFNNIPYIDEAQQTQGFDDNPTDTQGDLTMEVVGGSVDEGLNLVDGTFQVTGEIDIGPLVIDGVQDAEDLPSVESSAMAVGNNQSVSSTVATMLHEAQFNAGDADFSETSGPGFFDGEFGNLHTEFLAIASLAAASDILVQGDISATSTVSGITNAWVDSDATAMGNNLTVDLDAYTEGDAYLTADLTQFNYANVTALSDVSGVSVTNYANLGALEGPLVSSTAMAVGNNVSISVNSPEISPVLP